MDLSIEKLYWQDIRRQISGDPELIKIIDSLEPDENYPLFKLSYPFD